MLRQRDSQGGNTVTLTRRGLLAAGATLAAAPALAQGASWPDRPVRVIVPFPGGSTPDIAARAVAAHFQSVFGQPFVVENRAGAGGAIGTDAIAKATDGHTIGVSIGGPASTARVLNPALPYDPARDLAPVSLLVRLPIVFAVHPSVPARNLAEFVAHARANPGKLNYGSVGAGTLGHLVTAEFAARHGLDMTHVPFRSVPQGVTELVAGRIEAMGAVSGAVLPQVRDGGVRALGITSEGRFAAAPDIPTFTEQGQGRCDLDLDRPLRPARHAGGAHRAALLRGRAGAGRAGRRTGDDRGGLRGGGERCGDAAPLRRRRDRPLGPADPAPRHPAGELSKEKGRSPAGPPLSVRPGVALRPSSGCKPRACRCCRAGRRTRSPRPRAGR
jgi:tripartite-type tricarboxylate transporter receptor subunit TctC